MRRRGLFSSGSATNSLEIVMGKASPNKPFVRDSSRGGPALVPASSFFLMLVHIGLRMRMQASRQHGLVFQGICGRKGETPRCKMPSVVRVTQTEDATCVRPACDQRPLMPSDDIDTFCFAAGDRHAMPDGVSSELCTSGRGSSQSFSGPYRLAPVDGLHVFCLAVGT